MQNKVLTLEEFRAGRQFVEKDAEWCSEWAPGQPSQKVAEYADGSCFIVVNEDDRDYSLVIANAEWHDEILEKLEEILYKEWYLPEIAGVPRED